MGFSLTKFYSCFQKSAFQIRGELQTFICTSLYTREGALVRTSNSRGFTMVHCFKNRQKPCIFHILRQFLGFSLKKSYSGQPKCASLIQDKLQTFICTSLYPRGTDLVRTSNFRGFMGVHGFRNHQKPCIFLILRQFLGVQHGSKQLTQLQFFRSGACAQRVSRLSKLPLWTMLRC